MTLINSQTELTRFTVTVEGRTVCEVTVIQQERTEWRGEMWGHYLWDEDKDIFLCIQKTKRKENNAFQAKETGENLHTCKKKL